MTYEDEEELDFNELKEYFEGCRRVFEEHENSGSFDALWAHLYFEVPYLISYAEMLEKEANDKESDSADDEADDAADDAEYAWLLAMLSEDEVGDDSNVFENYPVLIEHVDLLLCEAYADWFALFPQKLCEAGDFLQSKGEYEKAFECFATGASLDYEGRQTLYPYVHVADCCYELGKCFEKGLGECQNYEKAIECYENAAEDENAYIQFITRGDYSGQELPAMGDLYLYGRGVEKSYLQALKCYFPGGKEPEFFRNSFNESDKQRFRHRYRMVNKIYSDYPRKEQLEEIIRNVPEDSLDDETREYLAKAKRYLANFSNLEIDEM